jgi:hypothetical protein
MSEGIEEYLYYNPILNLHDPDYSVPQHGCIPLGHMSCPGVQLSSMNLSVPQLSVPQHGVMPLSKPNLMNPSNL